MSHTAIGVGLGRFDDGVPEPSALFEYVDRADELGIDSIWMPDHPISERPALDPTVLQAVIAARTRDVKMGPSVLTLPARNPVAVANAYATLDYLTGGRERVIVALGLGAEPRLTEAIGVPADERAGRLREGLEVIRRLWTEDAVDYEGDYYSLAGVTATPKPPSGPLDVWIGGNSEAAMRRVAAYGDGWFPARMPPSTFAAKLDRLMDYCDEAGRTVERDEAGVIVPTYVHPDDDRTEAVRERYLDRLDGDVDVDPATVDRCTAFGTAAECVETIQRYVDAGCTKFVLSPAGPADEGVAQLETYAADVIPAFD